MSKRGLLAIRLRPLTVAACPAHGLRGAAGYVAHIRDAIASVRREVALGRRAVALSRGGVALGRGGVTRLGDTRPRVGRLLAFAGRVTAPLPAALIAWVVRGPMIVAVRLLTIGRHLVAVGGSLVRDRGSLVRVRALLVAI